MIVFKIDILKELKKKGYSQKYLISNKIFSKYTIQSFREIARQDSGANHNLELNTLNKLCLLLRMDPGDIIGVVPAKEDGDLLLYAFEPPKSPEKNTRKTKEKKAQNNENEKSSTDWTSNNICDLSAFQSVDTSFCWNYCWKNPRRNAPGPVNALPNLPYSPLATGI